MPVENDPSPELAEYAHPEKLVTADWLAAHLDDPNVVIVESDEDVLLYDTGHLPGAPKREGADYPVVERDDSKIRAYKDAVLDHMMERRPMVDVRSPEEFRGERTHMPEYPQEGVLRGGHIPGAASVPWKRAANDDGTFKAVPDLQAIYEGEIKLSSGADIVVYCRIGERSSHTWFVLTQLLGYPTVRNYDGSWTEWGNSVRVPIEKP